MVFGKGKGFAAASAALASVASGDSACTFTFPVGVAAEFKGKGMQQPPDCDREGIDEACCATIQHAIDVHVFTTQLIGVCSRKDQVGLYNCISKLPVAKKTGVTIPTAIASDSPEGTDDCIVPPVYSPSDGENNKDKEDTRWGKVSAGCCAGLHSYVDAASKYNVDSYERFESKRLMQERVDLEVGMIGKCGKVDQKEMLKMLKTVTHPANHDSEVMLAATLAAKVFQPTLQALMLPAAESELSATLQAIFPSIELAHRKDDASSPDSSTSTSLVTGLFCFIAGAATVGFGTFWHRRRSPALVALAEPMMA